MSTQCCPVKSVCVDPANPVQNFSAEAPDLTLFIGSNSGWDNSDGGFNTPSIGGTWDSSGCEFTCLSTISQADADQCAANQQLSCAVGTGNWNNPPGHPVQIAFNLQQSCQSFCPDGLPFNFTVPSGSVVSTNLARADEIAEALACQRARQRRLCLSSLNPATGAEGQPYTGTIVATGSFVDTQNNFWSIVSGSLPNGVTAPGISGPTLTLSGTPTQSGTFNFTMRITVPNGDFMQKNYTLTISGGPTPPTLYWTMDAVINPNGCGGLSGDIIDVQHSIRLSSAGASTPSVVPGKINNAVHMGHLSNSAEVADSTCSVFGTNFLAYNGGGFSISFWVRFQAPIAAPNHEFFAFPSSPVLFQTTPFVLIGLRYDNANNLSFAVICPNNNLSGNFGTVALNTWVFITLVYNPATNKITLMTNNASPSVITLVPTVPNTPAIPNFTPGTLYLGPSVGGDTTEWDVDELGVWMGYQFIPDNTAFLYNNGNAQRPAFS